MAFDRAATLRHAEKLLAQGKVDAAIAAYAIVIEHQPTDWNTANTLGDLSFRAGQLDRATELFTQSADWLAVEGFAAKAAAIYEKILKIRPDDKAAHDVLYDLADTLEAAGEPGAGGVAGAPGRWRRRSRRGGADRSTRQGQGAGVVF